ncbi:MAG TPA: hypothetical protein VGD84_17745 [Pseudonocardiaceae bacterium]
MDNTGHWRKRRRAGGLTFLCGLLCALIGMVYGLITPSQPDTPLFNSLTLLGIVLLVTGLGVAGIGLLSWVVAVLALRRRS